MILDYSPYLFLPELKWPTEIGERLKQFCEPQKIRDDATKEFYLQILSSLSLSYLEKHNVFSKVWELTHQKIKELEEVLNDEVKQFYGIYILDYKSILKVVCTALVQEIFLLKTYRIFDTPEEEEIILKKVISEWLQNDLKTLNYLKSFQNQNEDTPQKIILSYYQEDSHDN